MKDITSNLSESNYTKLLLCNNTSVFSPYSDPSFWANRDRTRDDFYRNEGYYGYNGIPPFSNGFIVMICIFFAFIGAGFQYLAAT